MWKLIVCLFLALIASGCSADSSSSNDQEKDLYKATYSDASRVDENPELKLPDNCQRNIPFVENNKFEDDGGFICTLQIDNTQCRVLYAQTVVPTSTASNYRGWSGNKRRYIPVQVLDGC